jgi:hypothetical protein
VLRPSAYTDFESSEPAQSTATPLDRDRTARPWDRERTAMPLDRDRAADRLMTRGRQWVPVSRSLTGRIGVAAGLLAGGIPTAIIGVTFVSVVFTGRPDTPFFTSVLAALFTVPVVVVAALLVCFGRARAPGSGYVVGAVTAALLGVLGIALVVVGAAVADGITH